MSHATLIPARSLVSRQLRSARLRSSANGSSTKRSRFRAPRLGYRARMRRSSWTRRALFTLGLWAFALGLALAIAAAMLLT